MSPRDLPDTGDRRCILEVRRPANKVADLVVSSSRSPLASNTGHLSLVLCQPAGEAELVRAIAESAGCPAHAAQLLAGRRCLLLYFYMHYAYRCLTFVRF